DPAPVDGDVGQDGRGRQVIVPEAVMQRLEMPDTFASLRVEADDALGKQVVAGPRAAVVVARGFFGRQIDVAEFLVRGEQRPDAAVARVRGRSVEPRVLAELTGPRNDVEGPQMFAGLRVEAADVVGRRFLGRLDALVQVVRCRSRHAADDDHVLHYDWS